ncbi:uncharacterized protein LOC128960164 [Oppia nitens]|uniref:uncharacterized protein LOC128960164 n=1 Tax=Oppia nitens TaxID=1686743 RepID=UPI0023DC7762|nr:uncharacterized protein LOC128960164 [Oppia nitens]
MMQKIAFTLLSILYVANAVKLTSLDDIKIINNNLDEKQKQFVLATVFNLLYNDTKSDQLAVKLASSMENKYGVGWISDVDINFSVNTKHYSSVTNKPSIQLQYETYQISLQQVYTTSDHIIAKIESARMAKPVDKYWTYINETARANYIARAVEIFRQKTVSFKQHKCLKLSEKQMKNDYDNNCFARLASDVCSVLTTDTNPISLCTLGEIPYHFLHRQWGDHPYINFELGQLDFAIMWRNFK